MAATASCSKDTNLAHKSSTLLPSYPPPSTPSPNIITFHFGSRISTHEFVASYSVNMDLGYTPSAWHGGSTQSIFLIFLRGLEGRTLLTIVIYL